MRPEDLSRTSWVVIAVLVGAAMAWLQTNWAEMNITQTHGQAQFESSLARPPGKEASTGRELPWITNITVYPPVQAEVTFKGPHGDYRPVLSRVVFEQLYRKGNVHEYRRGCFLAPHPYVPKSMSPEGIERVQDYLAKVRQSHPGVNYRYAWWQEPLWAYVIWLGGSVAVVGLAWPVVLNRLMLAGYGRKSEANEKKESLWAKLVGGRRKAAAGQGGKAARSTALTQEDLDRIAAMEARLGQGDHSAQETPEAAQDEGPVKKLEAAPLEALPELPKQEEQKDYGGEYYPTMAHGKKKG